jgi:hypothetical protein
MVDEHNQVFARTRPGRLNGVFGIRMPDFGDPSAEAVNSCKNSLDQNQSQFSGGFGSHDDGQDQRT